ncbi:polymeric immunoglobulin receptor-like [Seriola dumerili]|uniref:polymeric immunoglobulin receptor-like n=1 Tax=Seriola dumerili TaxID=41447 RepID=UPI000BBE10EA|nr:polymeric immunoglobulin receptor-like [Seriola dumerili]
MKVSHTLICCFFLSLQDGSAALVYSGTEGGDVTVQCSFGLFDQTKVFCKNQCKEEDILIETTNNRARSGRYSMEYKRYTKGGDLFVTITQLTKSDSGRYRCRLGTSHFLYEDLEIIVTDALLDGNRVKELHKRTGGTVTVECSFSSTGTWKFFCKNQCRTRDDILIETDADTLQRGRYSFTYLTGSGRVSLFVTITQLTTSDSGRYRCRQGRTFSSSSHRDFEIFVSDGQQRFPSTTERPTPPPTQRLTSTTGSSTTSSDSGMPLYACLTLVIVVILLSLALIMICIKRKNKQCGSEARGDLDGTNTEIALYENCGPVSTGEDATYQSLNPASRDQNQIYSTLTHS